MPSKRSAGLDLLRFVAVLMVIVSHLVMEPMPPSRAQYLAYFVGYGTAGVNLFFVLSGFLVSGLLFHQYKRHGELGVKRFYVRRAWKIYPAFYCLIGLSYVYCRWGIGNKIRDRVLARELFFFQNYAPGFWNHTWSLAVEEHFYIVLPLLLLYLVKRKGGPNPFTALPWLVLATSAVVLGLRCLTCYLQPHYSYYTHGFPTHLRIDGLFFGVLIAYYFHFHHEGFRNALHRWRYALIFAGAAGLISLRFITTSAWFGYTFWPLQEYLSSGAILCGVMLCAIPRNRFVRFFAAIGSFSYSIYLWHMVAIYFVTPRLRSSTSWDVRAIIYLIMAFSVGIIMAKLVELPTLTLRDRWYPAESKPVFALETATDSPAQLAA